MELFKLTTPKDDAWKVVESLGQGDVVQFLNMNEGVELTKLIYQNNIKLCEETERRILMLLNACKDYNIKVVRPQDAATFSRNISSIEREKQKSHDLLFEAIEEDVRDREKFVSDQTKTIENIKDNINELEDYRHVVEFIDEMTHSLAGARPAQPNRDAENPSAEPVMEGNLQFIAGTIKRDEMERMKRMLFRNTRGQALTYFKTFDQDEVEKVAYLVVFNAAGGNKDRVQKICDSFMGKRFEIPDMSDLNAKKIEMITKINKARNLYEISVEQLKDYLYELNLCSGEGQQVVSKLEIYKWFVAKEKAIYYALNMLKAHHQTFIGFMWIPSEKESVVTMQLQSFSTTEFSKWRATDGKGPIPPTSFKTNDMLAFHQMAVDTYKIATYGEINPAIFQVVTFPYLFAVMYGDYGHGSVFFMIGCIMCLFHNSIVKIPGMKGLQQTRYFWLMMGFFAIFQGLIYNEFFAVTNDWFGTCYNVGAYKPGQDIQFNSPTKDCTYYFGMDPTWSLSPQVLNFTNSMKEKLAVIIAYFHLNFGIVLNALNAIYFGKYQKLIFDVFTGVIIFAGLIGYMVVLVYFKWWYPVDGYASLTTPAELSAPGTVATSPQIITVVIADIMGIFGLAEKNVPEYYFYAQQQDVSNILVYATFICLPIMLCAIPCIFICCGPKGDHHDVPDEFSHVAAADEEGNRLIDDDNDLKHGFRDVEDMLSKHCPKDEGHGEIGEVFIHQIIETIEFVLGCISNTASYLRLWALSLAHGQLGEVFLDIFFTQLQTEGNEAYQYSTGYAIFYFFILCFGYMFAVFCVLFLMDVLEVFLHTMRLHWVEFMGKFYEGQGIAYRPFSFTDVFEKEQSRKE